ncbi:hypothetical protein FHS85_002926 [Rhodoligotrophos appendicifer]|uniref:hypothetical protein n=1 Tax=Rhodoligotrophos appendicifer TaxID=987056 RepID=UPI001186D623|nr:hypothetical protein [Rhodoligotrophos appendicifer]
MTEVLTYVEVDVDYCSLSYGVAPCTAEVGVTGDAKCFNTLATCQDRANFANSPVTLRFAQDADFLPREIDAIPSLISVNFSPAAISLGENLGTRASISIDFGDHPWPDTGQGFDKYVSERGYDPFRQGTFWGKFRARQPFLQGRPIRLIRGAVGQSLAEMETRHFIIESFTGPDQEGKYRIVAKDVLKLADADRAQAPLLSNGFLLTSIDADDMAITLTPSGVGNAEYPASGYAAIGGSEIVTYTRTGDAVTITARAQLNTLAQEHDGGDRFQVVLRYVAEDPAEIISDLLQTYASVPSGYIPLADWQTETATYLQRVYSADIAEPTGVDKLVSELVEQAALALWWDDINAKIKFQVLRAIPTSATRFDEENVLAGSFGFAEQPAKRLSQIWTYFGQINPLLRQTDPNNYRSVAATIDAEAEADYGSPAIRKIYSRWIPQFGRSIALRQNDIQLGRFRDPPRKFNFSVMRFGPQGIILGGGYRVSSWNMQDASGVQIDAPIQITRLSPGPASFDVDAEEVLFTHFDPDDLNNRFIIVDGNTLNFNLRTVHDTLYPEITAGQNLTCIVETGVIVGGSGAGNKAFDVGSWPADINLFLIVRGRIQGCGGRGADTEDGENPAAAGSPGGIALYTRYDIELDVDEGEIFGGAGGGGGGGMTFDEPGSRAGGAGSGGAGYLPGAGGSVTSSAGGSVPGVAGTTEAGGVSSTPSGARGKGGNGGGPGLAGQAGANGGSLGLPTTGGAGGAAGAAIDGISYVTVSEGPGDIRGSQIN